MNADYVQTASFHDVPGYKFKHPKFVNLSSQQLNPGTLPRYFQNQSEMGYNPVRLADLPEMQGHVTRQIQESEEIPSMYKRPGELQTFWEDANRSNVARFRTQSMKAWGFRSQ